MSTAVAEVSTGPAKGSVMPALGMVFLVAVVGLFGWAVWVADPAIDRSVIGMAGLPLAVKELEAVERPVREADKKPKPALRVLPLYDTDLRQDEEELSQSRDLRQELKQAKFGGVADKVTRAPTLVVLPKWRLGALVNAAFHPTYLVDASMRLPLLPRGEGRGIAQAEPVFETFETVGRFRQSVTLYAAQTIRLPPSDNRCIPVVWRGADRFASVLLARCNFRSTRFHLLSDPDLVNNHGLGVGGNAAFARAMVAELSGGGAAYLDLMSGEPFPRERRVRRERTWDDMFRFTRGPFALFWAALALLAALALWRGAVRFGRVDEGSDAFIEASRASMIDADARILRASGAVQPLLHAHAEQRLAALARRVFGRSARTQTFMDALARRAPEKAEGLRRLAAEVTPQASNIGAGTQVLPQSWLARFEEAIASAAEEFRT